jgi:hypothetical protein
LKYYGTVVEKCKPPLILKEKGESENSTPRILLNAARSVIEYIRRLKPDEASFYETAYQRFLLDTNKDTYALLRIRDKSTYTSPPIDSMVPVDFANCNLEPNDNVTIYRGGNGYIMGMTSALCEKCSSVICPMKNSKLGGK